VKRDRGINKPSGPDIYWLAVTLVQENFRSDIAKASSERMQLFFRRMKMFGTIEAINLLQFT